MDNTDWQHIAYLYSHTDISRQSVQRFQKLHETQNVYTKGEGAGRHVCAFFLPYDTAQGKIYLGHHIKANDWIPPGGHLEPGESPQEAAIREMKEELKKDIQIADLELWNLSVKEIGRPETGCIAHYDIWYLVHIPEQYFDFIKSEYYDARWFSIADGLAKIKKNPDFAAIISHLL